MRRFRLMLIVLLLLSLSQMTMLQTARPQRRALPPRQYIPARNYDTRHIALDLRFDWDKQQAIGTATISFSPLSPNLSKVTFDAASMTFNSVKLSSGSPLHFEAEENTEKLNITLDRSYQPTDVVTVVIDYHTNGTTDAAASRGLTFIKPRPDDPSRPRQIWSQGETEYNHYWFPCFDHPNDFITTEITATVEKPLIVISNGRLLETKENADATRTFHWKMDQPHASYLTSIVVGDYAVVEQHYQGIPVISYVYPNQVKEGKVTTARLAEMMKFFSEKTGVKYPYEKYSQTMARDFSGGMENITATTQTDTMIQDARSTLDGDQDGLQAHELAHQWFGDYVTSRAWSDIWLNESFATYFQAMWNEHRLGHENFLFTDVKKNQDAYYTAWRQGFRRPIVTYNYQNAMMMFDAYAYPRGGAVLHMLRMLLGEENWWRAIKHYLTKYAHQPVETEQFRIALEEATGQPLDWFFEQWVYKMGHPVFRVIKKYDGAKHTLTLTVKQEQKPDPNSEYPQAGLFRAPVDIEIGDATNTRIEHVWIEAKPEQTFSFSVASDPKIVNFDYGSTLIKELNFEKPTAELMYQLANDVDPMGRMWALSQLQERVKQTPLEQSEREEIVEAISKALTADKVWGMRAEAANALSDVPGEAARRALISATSDKNAQVRVRAINALGTSKDPTLANLFLEHLTDESYATVRASAKALALTKSAPTYEALAKLADVPSWNNNIKISAITALAILGDKRAVDLGLRNAVAGNPTNVRVAAVGLLATIGRDDPRVFALLAEIFRDSISTGVLLRPTGEALVTLGDHRGVEIFEEARKQVGINAKTLEQLGILESQLRQSLIRE